MCIAWLHLNNFILSIPVVFFRHLFEVGQSLPPRQDHPFTPCSATYFLSFAMRARISSTLTASPAAVTLLLLLPAGGLALAVPALPTVALSLSFSACTRNPTT